MRYQLTPHQRENFIKRKQLLEQIESRRHNPDFIGALWEKCKRDMVFWVNMFGWTFDPRLPPAQKEIPFLLYEFQEDAILTMMEHYTNQKDLFDEKSRDMGFTWIALSFLTHRWLFEENFTALIGSRKESLVDGSRSGEDLDPLMLRIDFILNKQPKFFLQNYDYRKNRNYLSINHPDRNSVIKGESANPDFGRQGRYSLIYIDEFGSWQFAQQAWQAASQSSPCRLVTTTPSKHGQMHFSTRLRFSGKIDVQTIHWTRHPFKDQQWYEEQKARMTDDEVARELDISYKTSIHGAVYPEWGEVDLGTYEYDPKKPLYASWDFGLADDTAIIWFQKDFRTDQVYIVDTYYNSRQPIDFYLPFVTGHIASEKTFHYTATDLKKIRDHEHWAAATHFGDPSAKQKHQAAMTTVEDQLRDHGIHLNYPRPSSWQDKRDKTKLLMRRLHVNEKEAQYFIDCIFNARYPERSETAQGVTEVSLPVHDNTSHFRSALEFFAACEPENAGGAKMVRPQKKQINPYVRI